MGLGHLSGWQNGPYGWAWRDSRHIVSPPFSLLFSYREAVHKWPESTFWNKHENDLKGIRNAKHTNSTSQYHPDPFTGGQTRLTGTWSACQCYGSHMEYSWELCHGNQRRSACVDLGKPLAGERPHCSGDYHPPRGIRAWVNCHREDIVSFHVHCYCWNILSINMQP